MPHLTVLQVKAFKEPGRYCDGNGLYLKVEPTGSRRWVLRLYVNGRRRDLGLGTASGPSAVTLAEAREEAAELRKVARRRRLTTQRTTRDRYLEARLFGRIHSPASRQHDQRRQHARLIASVRTMPSSALHRLIEELSTAVVARAATLDFEHDAEAPR